MIDLGDRISVDAYEAPARLRDQVDERDLVCSFPWVRRRGRYDVDHIVEYVEPEEGGRPDDPARRIPTTWPGSVASIIA